MKIFFKAAARQILSCCLFFIATGIRAQQHCVEGFVIEATTNEYLPDIQVKAFNGPYYTSVTTATGGKFKVCTDEKIDSLVLSGSFFESVTYKTINGNLFEIRSSRPITHLGPHPSSASLPIVEVIGFNNYGKNLETPGSFGLISKRFLQSNDQTSLQNSLNTIPGVMMDSRGYGGSHRLSIRGSFLRAPFGVRNVKMYMNGIALSSPDGTAPVEMIDPADLEAIEVIKGPAGSVWGSGNGGVLLMTAKKITPRETSIGSSITLGEYNWLRSANQFETAGEKIKFRLSHVFQENDGYREQEFNRKQQVSAFVNYNASPLFEYFLYATLYNGRWGLPGGLNAEQVQENPQQAVAYSVENNAMLWRERKLIGVSQKARISRTLENITSTYINKTNKQNPYGTSPFNNGHKIENAQGWGARTDFMWKKRTPGKIVPSVNFGGEFQEEEYYIIETENNFGRPGIFKYEYDVNYTALTGFVSADIHFYERVLLHAGMSVNNSTHLIQGYTPGIAAMDSVMGGKKIDLLPRIALSVKLDSLFYVHGSVSRGNSNPTIFEQIDLTDGTYNDLKPEQGINYEIGVKGKPLGFELEISAYEFRLTNSILPYEDTATTVLYFRNSGATIQQGLEFSLKRELMNGEGFFSSIYPWISFTKHEYFFRDYVVDDVQLQDYRLPGVPLHTVSAGLSTRFFKGKFEWNVYEYWLDRAPLDNLNTAWSSSYHLLNTRLDFRHTFAKKFALNLFVGVNNVLNEKYTSFYQVNGAFGRYYNPAPPVNVYGGVGVKVVL